MAKRKKCVGPQCPFVTRPKRKKKLSEKEQAKRLNAALKGK